MANDIGGDAARPVPDTRASLASRLVFHWVKPVLDRAGERPLLATDLFALDPRDAPERATAELEAARTRTRGRIAPALARTAWRSVSLALALGLTHAAASTALPLLLERFLAWLSAPESATGDGLLLAGGLAAGSIVTWGLLHHCFLALGKMTFRIRAALVGSVYRAILGASPEARGQVALGAIVNLVSGDVAKVSDAASALVMIVISLAIVGFAGVLLAKLMGLAAVFGLVALAAITPVTNVLARAVGNTSSALAHRADRRIGIIEGALRGIRTIKLNGWEAVVRGRARGVREEELRLFERHALWLSALSVAFQTWPVLVAVVTFAAHVALGGELRLPMVLATIAILGVLRPPLLFLPRLIVSALEGRVAIGRLEAFLARSPRAPIATSEVPGTVALTGADLGWSRDQPVLRALDLQVATGELVVVVGASGSGKTTLLTALAGEACVRGRAEVGGAIAFAAQDAWFFAGSVRENILCGAAWDEARYGEVLAAVGLDVDLASGAVRDLERVGDAGAGLSGGQRQRVGLARALYAASDVLLLDDPSSALDEELAEQVFTRAIVARRGTRIVATSRIDQARRADRVVVLDRGAIVEDGPPDALLRRGGAFARLDELARKGASGGAAGGVRAARADDALGAGPVAGDALAADDEAVESGAVAPEVYRAYVRAMGSPAFVALIALLFVAREALAAFGDIWLSLRSGGGDTSPTRIVVGYAAFAILAAVATFARSLLLARGGIAAAQHWHDRLIESLVRAPFAFFDATPLGRILNRFTRDQRAIDTRVVSAALDTLNVLFSLGSAACLIFASSPFALVVLAPFVVVYARIQSRFRRASRAIARLDAVAQGPLVSGVEQAWLGLGWIRPLRREGYFETQQMARIAAAQRATYAELAVERWLSFRLDALGGVLLGSTALLAIALHGRVSAELASLAVTYVLTVTSSLQRAVHATAELESGMTAVERVREYAELAPEAGHDGPARGVWPSPGRLAFENVRLAYGDPAAPALREVSFVVEPGERVGVVGRSGSGKSSLIAALARTTPLAGGRIMIEGTDATSVGLAAIRERVTIVSQNPVLFEGTLRENLDPEGRHPPEALTSALASVGVLDALVAQGVGLETLMGEGQVRLGAGHRQLVCLARALLRRARIVVLDEATATVDVASEDRLLDGLESALAGVTVLVIAHRLEALRGVDRVLVMDRGEIVRVVDGAAREAS